MNVNIVIEKYPIQMEKNKKPITEGNYRYNDKIYQPSVRS